MPENWASPAVEMCGIIKRFGSFVANDAIDLAVMRGEVHALLGENGAGKSTLMNVLYGLYKPDGGEIRILGAAVHFSGPGDAMAAGIGMVHQHFMLVPVFTVTENIVLGQEVLKGGALNMREARRRVVEISEKYNLIVDPDAKIEDISVGMQQRVEIIKALYRGADILILDEPTAVLTPQEIDELMLIIAQLSAQGKTIIIITHKLNEIKKCASKCTVIRRGKLIGTVNVADIGTSELANMMVGYALKTNLDKPPLNVGGVAMAVSNLHIRDARGLHAVNGMNFVLNKGEILALAGVDGNGQSELTEALMGLRRIESGSITVNGKDISHASTGDILNAGVNCIPQDRQRRGLVMPFTVAENIAIEARKGQPIWLDLAGMRDRAQRLAERFDIRPSDASARVDELSGGNQQKVIIARVIDENPDVLIAVQPTRGLDVGAIMFVHNALIKERAAGRAILLVSLELDEVMSLADRIIVMYDGRAAGELSAADADERRLGIMMTGGAAAS